ncbi:NAD(P)H-quinone oxidoreductase [bacterium]|nr:NAD(P)H-quinone oxidoreductase [bacterium]
MIAFYEPHTGQHLLHKKETAVPLVGSEEVLIRVKASGVNRADLLQRRGLYPPPTGITSIMGLECAGEIEQVGETVIGWKSGDRVCALLAGGGYAEFACVHSSMLLKIPGSWSYEQAAAFPEAFYTAYYNLFRVGHLQGSQSVLIHAGGSGVGTAAIQLAHARLHKIFTTVGSDEKALVCHKLGADDCINYKTDAFEKKILTITDGYGTDVILDVVGAKYLEANLHCLAHNGKLVIIGLMGGIKSSLDLSVLLNKNLMIRSTTLRNQPLSMKSELTQHIRQDVMPLAETGKIKPIVDSVFSFDDVEQAHERMLNNKNFGKIVLTWS